jgi:hypothetical protein
MDHQLTFAPSGTACESYCERKFGDQTKCRDCGESLVLHTQASPSQVALYIAATQMKQPASLIELEGDEVTGKLWIGGLFAALPDFSSKHDIVHVVNCAKGLEEMFPAWAKKLDPTVDRLGLNLVDAVEFPLTEDAVKTAVGYIHNALVVNKASCLVHCAQGKRYVC